MTASRTLNAMYTTLLDAMGPSGWWPGDHPFEVAVGAVLTQNTNWGNVEKALANLRTADALTPAAMIALNETELAELIRPAGFFRVKAARLGNLLRHLATHAERNGSDMTATDLAMLRDLPLDKAREGLLEIRGIGPETADSILLYALDLPTFVVDAYTARILRRHGLAAEDDGYHDLQEMFMAALPENTAIYGEYHALIVRAGKHWCRKSRPRCAECPLCSFLNDGESVCPSSA